MKFFINLKLRDRSVRVALILTILGVAAYADSNKRGPHGGQLLDKNGAHYEIVRNPRENNIEVYAFEKNANLTPSTIIVILKEKNNLIDRVHLKLIQEGDPTASSHYIGTVPSRILVSAGLTFDLEF